MKPLSFNEIEAFFKRIIPNGIIKIYRMQNNRMYKLKFKVTEKYESTFLDNRKSFTVTGNLGPGSFVEYTFDGSEVCLKFEQITVSTQRSDQNVF